MAKPQSVNNDRTTRDTRFKPGNPGRPAGTPNKRTLALQEMVEGEAEAITRKAIELAKAGDPTALRLMLDRLLPARKGARVTVPMPTLEAPADVVRALAAVASLMAAGEIS